MEYLNIQQFHHKKLVYVSPHHDDMVLSSGGLIGEISTICESLVLINVFTKSLWAPGIIGEVKCEKVETVRTCEDRFYCEKYGIEQMNLGFRDSSVRGYDADSELAAEVCNDKIYHDVLKCLRKLIKSMQYDFIFCPVGVGNHIDHKIVLEALRGMEPGKILFYEDLPYAVKYNELEIYKSIKGDLGELKEYFIDITRVFDKKIEDILLYQSQLESDLLLNIRKCAERFKGDAFMERIWVFK
ncbi:MAG: PIG-L family deacetylase [Clostridia bacterium]|nr:PIG-L family deacetylase [Clostridia bacterium]